MFSNTFSFGAVNSLALFPPYQSGAAHSLALCPPYPLFPNHRLVQRIAWLYSLQVGFSAVRSRALLPLNLLPRLFSFLFFLTPPSPPITWCSEEPGSISSKMIFSAVVSLALRPLKGPPLLFLILFDVFPFFPPFLII